jgi:hypothetical protein
VYELVHLLAQRVIFLCQPLGQMLLIDNLLGSLIAVERQATTGTLHDDGWTQPAEYTGLVVFGWIQSGNNDVVWVVERRATCWTCSVRIGRPRESSRIGALCAEDMAVAISTAASTATTRRDKPAGGNNGVVVELGTALEVVTPQDKFHTDQAKAESRVKVGVRCCSTDEAGTAGA